MLAIGFKGTAGAILEASHSFSLIAVFTLSFSSDSSSSAACFCKNAASYSSSADGEAKDQFASACCAANGQLENEEKHNMNTY
jgi:hypothetical protein